MKKKSRRSNIVNKIKEIRSKDDWRDALDSTLINDDHWRCIVTMMVETIVAHAPCVSLFNEAVAERERMCIYSLSYQKAIDTVKTLSKQDPKKCPAIEGICHYANTVLNENNDRLSTWLLARIVKYLIYRAKIAHIGRLKVEAGREIDGEHRTVQNIDGSTSSRSATKPPRAHSNEIERAFNGKASTRLHEDDVPLGGPSLYVVLSGFRDPDLPTELLSVGVPLACILEIKFPDEQYVAHREAEGTHDFLEDYRVDENELREFWTVTRQRFAQLSAYPAYSNVAVLTFSPPLLPRTFNATEKEFLKRDVYDRVLSVLCHLSDLCRRHAKYLESMRLEKRIIDDRDETADTKIYEDALNDVPNEYINVPLILGAMLMQVESNLARSTDGCPPVKRNIVGSGDADVRRENTTAERSSVSATRDKLELLDVKYELAKVEADDNAERSSRPSDIAVVPYGDTLSVLRHFLDRGFVELDDAVMRVLRDPRVINAWRDRQAPTRSKAEMYACHLNNIARAFGPERAVSREEVAHYLHLLMFDKLIFSEDEAKMARLTQPSRDQLSEYASTVRRTRSASDLTSPSMTDVGPSRAKSDTEIDYGKPVAALTDCPLLFALTDTRETLLPGYLYAGVSKGRSYVRAPSLEEYEDVELLPGRVFPQLAHECFQSFDRFATGYFEPTDTVLLYFGNNDGAVGERASTEACLSTIPTPIGLWEFCEYIATEGENWTRQERETERQSRKTDLTERFMKRSVEVEDDAIIFDDECFVLPDSLKARHLEKDSGRDVRKKISRVETREPAGANVGGEKTTGRKRGEAPTASNGGDRTDGGVTSGKTSMIAKKSDAKTDDVDTSFLPAGGILSSRRDEESETSRDSVGYDLGNLRVQVTHRREEFLLGDDTTVQIVSDDWLHGDLELRVAVTLRGCALRLSRVVGRSADAFRLTTRTGIVLGFCRNGRSDELAATRNPFDCQRRNSTFDFRASWPTGLSIEPTIGDDVKNPFCIRQSYVSKRPGPSAGAAREVRRNFLGNGTVLKYMDDNTVVILRPNGVIVTCTDFDKPQSPGDDESIRSTAPKARLGIGRSDSWQSAVEDAERGGSAVGSRESRSNGSIVDTRSSKQRVTSDRDSLITGALAADEVLRYSVVNYDGRRYEVLNDLVVSEHDRLLVTTTSDYEVNEVFTRRADGTDTLLRSNGELIVTFPDGTTVITGYAIEEQPVICEWSEDELQRYFGFAEMKGYRAAIAPSSDNSPVPRADHRERPTRVSIADGFVSILLTFRMEHKDYATVSYDRSAVKCTLSMPDNLRVSVSRGGHYEVSMGDEVNLKIHDDDAVFTKICTTCGGKSTSTYEFRESRGVDPRTILTTIDILGNALEVKSDGAARYHPRGDDRRCVRGRRDDGVLEDGDGESGPEVDAKSEARIHSKHERYCEMLKFPARSQYRIFAMNRDLTACEYLHRSVGREVAAVFGDGTSMIQYPISRRPELRRLITFVPVEPELGSKEISCQYRVTSDKRTDYGRTKLPRSTYSLPYNWLFPFGKEDQEVPKRTRGEVLAERNEQPLPKLLRVRVLFGIKEADRSALIDMQRAMGSYWISVFRDGDKCRLFYATGSCRVGEVENDYGSSESGLRELALGVKGSIDVETYVRSLRGKLIKLSTEAPRQSSRLAELLRQRGSIEVEYEWYKQCMRKRIMVPYFRNITDSRYSVTKDNVDGNDIEEKSILAGKGDELIDAKRE